MAVRIKLPEDREPLFIPSNVDWEFEALKGGDVFEFPDDFHGFAVGNKYRGKFIVVKRVDDDSPLKNCGDILYVKKIIDHGCNGKRTGAVLSRLKAKKPFLYEDSKGILAISGEKVVRTLNERHWTLYQKYKNVISDSTDKEGIRKIINAVSFIARTETKDYIDVEGKIIPWHGLKHININEYWESLSEKEKECLREQVARLEQLHKMI